MFSKIFEKRQKVELPAISQGDMRSILNEYGLAEKVDSGVLTCPETGETITWESIGAIKVVGHDLQLYSIHADSIYAA